MWETGARWDMGADLPLQEGYDPLLCLRILVLSRHVLAPRRTSIDKLACLLMRVNLDAWENLERTSGESSSAILGKARGPQDIEGRRGREDLTWGVVGRRAFTFSSQLHACLPLPCLAMPCFAFLKTPSFSSYQFPGGMDWKDDQVLSMFLQLVTLASRSPPPPQH